MGVEFNGNPWLAIPLIALAGLMSGLSPCTVPTVLLVTGYVTGRSRVGRRQGFWLSCLFVLGTAITWSLLGAFAGLVGAHLAHAWWFKWLLSGVLLLMGLWMLGGIDIRSIGRRAGIRLRRGSGALGALLLGMLMAITTSPCTMPVALSVLAYASAQGSMLVGALLMALFALGRGLPLVVVGTFSGWLQSLQQVHRYQHVVEKLAGLIMLGLGAYYLLR